MSSTVIQGTVIQGTVIQGTVIQGTRVLRCGPCGIERAFEQPPCEDVHDDCPEWACVECGSAVTLAVLPTTPMMLEWAAA